MIPNSPHGLDPVRPLRARRSRPDAEQTTRLCLLTPLHRERGLSLALVKHLAEEIPGILFTLRERPGIDVVWICGYEHGNAEEIRDLRLRYPSQLLLVTSKEPESVWADEALLAGADSALAWPVDLALLGQVLRRKPAVRPA
jgi:hypothetical protein